MQILGSDKSGQSTFWLFRVQYEGGKPRQGCRFWDEMNLAIAFFGIYVDVSVEDENAGRGPYFGMI